KKKLSKMIDEKLPGLLDEKVPDLLDEKLSELKLGENEETELCRMSNKMLEHANRINALELNQEDTQMVSALGAAAVGLMVAMVVSGIVAIILGNIIHNLKKDIDNIQSIVAVDSGGRAIDEQSGFAVMVDDSGQVSEVLPMVDFEKTMKDAGVQQGNIEYNCGEQDDYYSVCVYLRGGYSSKKSGSVTFSKNTLSEVAEVQAFVYQKKASGDGRESLVDKHFQYYDRKILDSGEVLRQRFNWDEGYLEMEDVTDTKYIVVKISNYSFLISQEEYEALLEALKALRS
ncbi:hypothetical protein IKD57_01405, partial [Candidatus Saccharibacteria bacterium]|nr:hypothetical protein [Candidatus Saccharibacteria bacterium]